MKTATPSIPDQALSPRLAPRLASLGVLVVSLEPGGRAVPQGTGRPLETLLLAAPALAAALRARWNDLAGEEPQALALWPGLYLAPLPRPRRRRAGKPPPAVLAALLLGPELLASEQLRAVCHAAGVDPQALAARVDRTHLLSEPEAQRLAATLTWMGQDANELDLRDDEILTLSQQLGEAYEELSLLYKLSTSMTVDQPPAHFLTEACHELQQTTGLKWMAIQLTEEDPRLNELAGQFFVAGDAGCDAGLLRRLCGAIRARCADTPAGTAQVIDDTGALPIPHLARVARRLLVAPLTRDGKPLGALIGGDKLDGSHISSIDAKLCSSLASSLSIFLDNMMLYEDMQAMFLGTLHALTASIDAKDRYTHGHSERVALMARMLAGAAGLDEATRERVYLAGLVHDVGKIGVPEALLCKPGRLTEQEFALIKEHPSIGARILQDIRQMQDLIPGVLHHHERWDGRGYPDGLAGADIPLFGRLIGLADAFDAMSSNRTYRPSLSREKVLEEIRRCAGTQFDPELAARFVELDLEPFFQMVQKHQAQSLQHPSPAAAATWDRPALPGVPDRSAA